jgi:hypothetical protein
MKAFAAIVIVVGVVLLPAAGVHAKPSGLGASAAQRGLHPLRHQPAHGRATLSGDVNAPPQQVQSGVVKDASQLKVPFYVYPSDFTVAGQTVTAHDADDPSLTSSGLLFAFLHYDDQPDTHVHFFYKDVGMLFGYAEVAQKVLADKTRFYVEYLASAYSNPDSAVSALNGLVSYYGTYPSARSTTCSVSGAEQCLDVSFPDAFSVTDQTSLVTYSYTAVVRIVQKSNSVFEGGYFLVREDFSANSSVGQQVLTDLVNAYIALFTGSSGGGSTSTPTAAPTLQLRPTSTPTSVPPTSTPVPTATPTRTPRPLQPTKTPTPKPPKPTPTPKPTPKPTPRPPVQGKFSFSFDSLVATDGRGHVPRTFALGKDVRIVATYTVRNLKRGHIVSGRLFRTYQQLVKGKVHDQVQSSDPLVVAKSGTYKNPHDTVFERQGTIRVIVKISFKKITQTKTVMVNVR